MASPIKPIRIAFGHQSRVGKDTAADYICNTYGANTCRFSSGIYHIAESIQAYLGRDKVKDPGLLQFLGEGLRQHYGDDVWVNPARESICDLMQLLPQSNITVTDLRHINEAEMLTELGFITVKIVRPDCVIDRDPNHISETALANYNFDYTIINDGTVDELYDKLDNIIYERYIETSEVA